jgi:hypothetical protein
MSLLTTIERFLNQADKPDMLARLAAWFRWMQAGQCQIRSADGAIIPLVPNRCQLEIIALMLRQAANERPIRIVCLKARKVGVSTIVSSLFYFLCGHFQNQRAILLAHEESSTRRIFDIVKVMNNGYRLIGGEEMASSLRCPDTNSDYFAYTAGGRGFGVGQTPSLLHCSEVDLWASGTQRESFAAVADSLPSIVTTVLVAESTCSGRGVFWNLFEQGADPESWYENHFTPWYFLDEAVAPADNLVALTDEENLLRKHAKTDGVEVTDEMLAWRRAKRLEIGDLAFKRQFPATPEEVVQAATGLVLPGLRDCVVDELPFDPGNMPREHLVGGVDHGYHDATAVVTAVFVDRTLWIIDGYVETERLAHEVVAAFHARHRYFVDPSALAARQEIGRALRQAGVEASLQAAPRARGTGATTIVEAEWQSVRNLINQGRLKILRGSHDQLILESDNFAYSEKTGQPDTRRGEGWGHFDTLDALRYCVMGVSNRLLAEDDDWEPMKIVSARRESLRKF